MNGNTVSMLKFNCGCGFTTPSVEEARKHVEDTKHTMDALGTIRPTVKPTRLPLTLGRPSKPYVSKDY